jgi:hypothetical protein
MKRSWLMSLLVAAALASLNMPAFAQSDSMEDLNAAVGNLTSKVNALEKKGLSVEVHGFVQQDIMNDSTQSFNETVGDGKVAQNGTVAGDNGYTQYSLRNSRINFLAKSDFGGWATKGYIEADFLGNGNSVGYTGAPGSETEQKFFNQPLLRLRHAYLQADNDGWSILAGQYWSLFGWNMDYVLATVAEAPTMGPLYFRTPQLRISKTFGDDKGVQVALAASAEKPDQIDGSVPNLNFGLRLTLNDIKGEFCQSTGAPKLMPLSVGLGLRNADYSWNSLVPGGGANYNYNQSMWGSAVAADVLLPVLPVADGTDGPSIVLTGEWTAGAGDTDAFNGGGFGGNNTTVVNTAAPYTNLDPGVAGFVGGNFSLIQIQSLTAQIQIALPKSIGTIVTAGYGEIFTPNGIPLGDTYNDDRTMFLNVMQDLTPAIRVGLEYATYDTHYGNPFGQSGQYPQWDAVDNRVQMSSWYRF